MELSPRAAEMLLVSGLGGASFHHAFAEVEDERKPDVLTCDANNRQIPVPLASVGKEYITHAVAHSDTELRKPQLSAAVRARCEHGQRTKSIPEIVFVCVNGGPPVGINCAGAATSSLQEIERVYKAGRCC